MGKASRAKNNRLSPRSRSDLLELLVENLQFLERSAAAFDGGYDAEAKRLAVVLRVLVHDTSQSHSLLGQLGIKERLWFLDTAEPINPRNLAPTPGLVFMRATMTADGLVGQYVAPLDTDLPHESKLQRFAGWWQNPVMKVDQTWARKQLVLALANQEGGAHVDPSLNDDYEALAKRNRLGWSAGSAEGEKPFTGNPIAAAVRQITYELLETLNRERQLLS